MGNTTKITNKQRINFFHFYILSFTVKEMNKEVFEPLLSALKKRRIEIYRERNNSGIGRSLPFGLLNRRNFGLGRSRNNKRYLEHYKEALKLAELVASDIKWTTIMINDNYKALPHYDKNNDGESWIVGFGDYEGGELNIEGEKIDIRYKPYKMDASVKKHWVEDWVGERYTIVFFRVKLLRPVREKYEGWGFKELNDLLGEYSDSDCLHKIT